MEMFVLIALTTLTAGIAYLTLKSMAQPKVALKPIRIEEERSSRRRIR